MKTILLTLSVTVLSWGGYFCAGWAAIEFILYLFKDDPYNWTSFWMAGMFWAMCAFLAVLGLILKVRKSEKDIFTDLKRRDGQPKSKFEQRLQDAMNARYKKN